MLDFFAGFDYTEVVALTLSGVFGVLPGLKLFSWLKGKLGWEDHAAHYMVLGVSVLLTGSAMFVTGKLDVAGLDFTLANVVEYAGVLYAASQVAYKRLNI